MRSIRTAALLAAAALVAVAFAVPAVASAANWKQNGQEVSGLTWTQEGLTLASSGNLALSGTTTLQSGALGTISCPTTVNLSLSPGNGGGQLTEFVATPSGCKLGGLLKSICTKVTAMTMTEPVPVTAKEVSGKTVIASNEAFSFLVKIEGAGCPESWLFVGKLNATPDSTSGIGSVALGGEFETYYYSGGEFHTGFGKVAATGTLSASPAGKYGISAQRLVKVTGSVERASGLEGVTCAVTGTIALEPGSSGKLLSLSNAGPCGIGWCNPSSINVGTPWTLSNTGSAIKATGVSWSGSGCVGTISGVETTMSVDKTSAISSTSFSFETKVFGINHKYNGTLNWNPAGIFGL
jgi:hypothetical protein